MGDTTFLKAPIRPGHVPSRNGGRYRGGKVKPIDPPKVVPKLISASINWLCARVRLVTLCVPQHGVSGRFGDLGESLRLQTETGRGLIQRVGTLLPLYVPSLQAVSSRRKRGKESEEQEHSDSKQL